MKKVRGLLSHYKLPVKVFDAPVAQGIEHRPPKPSVGGSNPPRRAR